MGTINKQISRYECTAVYAHPDAKVDIVLVHGLNGDPQRTWTAKNGVFWPTDLLPGSLKDARANILVYGYNADVYSTHNNKSASDNFIHHHAQTLVTTLTHYRKSEESMKNAIIWVCHSLGGILVKRALEYSNDLRVSFQDDYRSIFVSTYAIIFLGTPHTGSGLAVWGHVLQAMSDVIVPKKLFESEPVLLKTLKRDNETLQNINSHFLDIYQRFKIHMAHENHKTDVKGTRLLVVDSASASPQLPGVTYYSIEATHSGMTKFESVNAPGYRTVSTALREWVHDAPETIQIRWDVEEEERLARARQDVGERMRPFITLPTGGNPQEARLFRPQSELTSDPRQLIAMSPTSTMIEQNSETALALAQPSNLDAPSPLPLLPEPPGHEVRQGPGASRPDEDPIFIHPESFRPNSVFIGRDAQLKELHSMLMDKKRRAEGTSAVLLQCLPGGGKTHLARQYVYQHKLDYPGGIYWVRAKSLQEMEYGYWRIARNDALRDLVEEEDLEDLKDPRKLVDIVRKWLNSFEDWLLILDGILFDMPEVHRFIPDAKRTSIIYTSTDRAVSGDHHFDNPQIMELPLLDAQDARDLLLLEMEKKRPWTQDDKSRALELVQLMGRLPLMIHVTAQHLKATREPLAKYLKSYRSRPKVGDLPAYNAVWDQLQHRGATAALNLMSILVFFDQHIPVEMISLGLSALDNRTPYKTRDTAHRKATLNNTLKILIAFALVERTESTDLSPISSRSSKTSFDRASETLDLLRIHNVVQIYFIESLTKEKQHLFWLERAVAVFCRSFDEGEKRIQGDTKVGLPDDYRRFAIHGRRLLEHINRLEKKSPDQLSAMKSAVERRMESIQISIHTLSQDLQKHILDNSAGEVPQVSVFERSSSLSETDSEPPSNGSTSQEERWEHTASNDPVLYQSPSTYSPHDFNPYHWHIPYPHTATIPAAPFQDDDEQTVTQTPVPRSPGHKTSDANSPYSEDAGWQRASLNHRVVKRAEIKRYHDRAGAWRDRSIGDPRVSMSRETAKGSIYASTGSASSMSRFKMTAGSEAELALNKIKQISPPSPRARGDGQEVNDLADTSASTRPPRVTSRGSISRVLSGETTDDPYENVSPDRSNNPSVVPSTSAWATSALKRLKENVRLQQNKPVTGPKSDNLETKGSNADHERLIGHDEGLDSPPAPMFQGTRSTKSSPAQTSSPYSPPNAPPTETSLITDTRQETLPTFRHWDTHAYHPGLGRIDSSSLSEEPMAMSYPSLRQPPYAVNLHPPEATWTGPADGYTSQPMSRDPSHQSSDRSSAHPPSNGSGGPQTGAPVEQGRSRHSSPLGGSPVASGSSRPVPVQGRRPSLVETEPSPRLDSAFPEIDTSYQRWEQKYVRRPRAGSGSLFPNSTSMPSGAIRRMRRGGSNSPGRSQSQSPNPAGRVPLSLIASQGSSAIEEDSEPMVRSGSGGIRLADGRVVEFGQAPVDINMGGRRTQGRGNITNQDNASPDFSEVVGLGIVEQ